ncbi:MAG: peptidylprolyl isomerase [Candidatus Omnitrophota bacterium]|nr:peptidylprolyl isomerase [Candidatus Omnitrophota bacterium]
MAKFLLAFIVFLSAHIVPGSAVAEDSDMIEDGKKVKMHFTMTADDQVLESTFENEPFEFTFGKDPIVPGLAEQVLGLKVGERKTFDLAPPEGFGEHDPKGVLDVPRANFPESDIEAGMSFSTQNEAGQPLRGMVKKVEGETVTIDFNHPLAGKTIHFDVEIVEVT